MSFDTSIDRLPIVIWFHREIVVSTVIYRESELHFQIISSEGWLMGMGKKWHIITEAFLQRSM